MKSHETIRKESWCSVRDSNW